MRYLTSGLLIKNSDKICKDLVRWKEIQHLDCSSRVTMAHLLWRCTEFGDLLKPSVSHPASFDWPVLSPLNTLDIDALEILYIQHGFATEIAAKSIGETCWINWQVTIGYNGQEDPPVIGDNVAITCGAKVLDPIHIGNHVTVSANAVIIIDVPDDCVADGVPAKNLKFGS